MASAHEPHGLAACANLAVPACASTTLTTMLTKATALLGGGPPLTHHKHQLRMDSLAKRSPGRVRCFVDDNIVHVSGSVDPLRDIEIITLELVLADLAQVEKRLQRVQKDAKSKKEGAADELAALEVLLPLLNDGVPARKADLDAEGWKKIKGLGLLSAKPIIYAACT